MLNIFQKNVAAIDLHDHVAQFVELGTGNGNPELISYNRVPIPDGIIEDGIIKKENAARNISRITKKINSL